MTKEPHKWQKRADVSADPELADLRRALIHHPDHWRWINQIMASSGKAISPRMTYLLALAIFAGYELFPRKNHAG